MVLCPENSAAPCGAGKERAGAGQIGFGFLICLQDATRGHRKACGSRPYNRMFNDSLTNLWRRFGGQSTPARAGYDAATALGLKQSALGGTNVTLNCP